MESTDLYLEHDKVFVIDKDSEDIKKVDYDGLKVGNVYYVITKTNRFSIYKKSENFDDEFLKLEGDLKAARDFLRNCEKD